MLANTRKTGLFLALLSLPIAFAYAGAPADANGYSGPPGDSPFMQQVQQATAAYRDINVAAKAGWFARDSFCVSGPDHGAMGVHVVNPALLGPDQPDISAPQILIYEPQADGSMRLVGVEYVVIAAGWDAKHTGLPPGVPNVPTVAGHLMNLVPTPNRYGLPAVYELHAWAWRNNTQSNFADWNPNVTCEKQSLPASQ